MTNEERIDSIEARAIALQIALTHVMSHAAQGARDAVARSVNPAFERGLWTQLTDQQIDEIQSVLRSMPTQAEDGPIERALWSEVVAAQMVLMALIKTHPDATALLSEFDALVANLQVSAVQSGAPLTPDIVRASLARMRQQIAARVP